MMSTFDIFIQHSSGSPGQINLVSKMKGIQIRKEEIKLYLVTEIKMARRLAAFLENAWTKEQVLVKSFTIRGLAIIIPPLSPYTKYAVMINQVTPYNYPVPIRDDGNMYYIPSHPQDPQGPSLEWLKKL